MNAEKLSPDLLKNRPHFDILDGLRGVAALAVVIFHFMEVAYSDYSKNFIAHGFLAVDFFFCLSGFVIAYAYDGRIEQMGVAEFLKSRLIRLHPLVILGSVLGLLGFFFDPFGGHPELYGVGRLSLIFLCSILLIPFPVMPDRFFNLFGLNAPAWSLFWEYVANLLYALVLYRLGRRWLFLLLLLSAGALCLVMYRTGNLLGGWAGENFWDGCARVAYSFLAGMLIYRSRWIIKTGLGFIELAIGLALAFVVPFSTWNWLTELLTVLFYFPLLIALGAGATLTPGLRKLCVLSGNLSYPLYMTHYAVLWTFADYYNTHKPGTAQLFWIILVSVILLVGVAYIAMRGYDLPIRTYLNRKRKQGLRS